MRYDDLTLGTTIGGIIKFHPRCPSCGTVWDIYLRRRDYSDWYGLDRYGQEKEFAIRCSRGHHFLYQSDSLSEIVNYLLSSPEVR